MPGCNLLFPNKIPCSSHGVCDEFISSCICNRGWSSFGDYALTPGFDCDQNINTIRALWLILLTISAVQLVYYTRVLTGMFFLYRCKWWSEPVVRFTLCLYLSCCGWLFLSILKASDPEHNRAGNTFSVTFLIGCNTMFPSYAFIFFTDHMLLFFSNYFRSMAPQLQNTVMSANNCLKKFRHIYFTAITCACFVPLLSFPFPKMMNAFVSTYFTSISVLWCFSFFFCQWYMRLVRAELHEVIETAKSTQLQPNTDKLKHIHAKISATMVVNYSVGYSLCLILLIFAAWPELQRMCSYFFPVFKISGALALPVGLLLIAPKESLSFSGCNKCWARLASYLRPFKDGHGTIEDEQCEAGQGQQQNHHQQQLQVQYSGDNYSAMGSDQTLSRQDVVIAISNNAYRKQTNSYLKSQVFPIYDCKQEWTSDDGKSADEMLCFNNQIPPTARPKPTANTLHYFNSSGVSWAIPTNIFEHRDGKYTHMPACVVAKLSGEQAVSDLTDSQIASTHRPYVSSEGPHSTLYGRETMAMSSVDEEDPVVHGAATV